MPSSGGFSRPSRAAMMAASSVNLAKQTLPLAVGGVVLVAAIAFIAWRRAPAKHLVGGALIRRAGAAGLPRDWRAGRRRVRAGDRREHQRHARPGGRCADLPAHLDRLEDQLRHRLRGRHPGRRAGPLRWPGATSSWWVFEQPADMLRYASGGALMGAGGVLALGLHRPATGSPASPRWRRPRSSPCRRWCWRLRRR